MLAVLPTEFGKNLVYRPSDSKRVGVSSGNGDEQNESIRAIFVSPFKHVMKQEVSSTRQLKCVPEWRSLVYLGAFVSTFCFLSLSLSTLSFLLAVK